MDVWSFIQQKLSASQNVMLLWVLQSEGSSPGRRGFKMAVSTDGSFQGTIGGGIMEYKLVEKAKTLLTENCKEIFLQRQHHDKDHAKDQSGMICSGSQLIAFVPFSNSNKALINSIIDKEDDRVSAISLSKQGLSITTITENKSVLQDKDNDNWKYTEPIKQQPIIYIIGGGHVSLALSELMHFLGFHIMVYDNRNDLHTMNQNNFAHQKNIVNYEEIGAMIDDDENAFLVIMTYGYRDDKTVFRQLMKKHFFYAGMMGSVTKIDQLTKELVDEGYTPDQWKHWFMPIGINIHSKTTKEIAISIAAEIIQQKNKQLASQRTV